MKRDINYWRMEARFWKGSADRHRPFRLRFVLTHAEAMKNVEDELAYISVQEKRLSNRRKHLLKRVKQLGKHKIAVKRYL